MARLLLISNSFNPGMGFIEHCADEIREFLADRVSRLLFVPFALFDHDAYTATARTAIAGMGYELDSLHQAADAERAVAEAEALFIGGGNTFRLLLRLYELRLLDPIRQRVAQGMPYLGSSAGTNVACPTIRTTNDMPIVQPPSFDALGLVPFQINPHYLDPDPSSTHQGETRERRLTEFLEENDRVVVGLREGSWLRVEADQINLRGMASARIFERGHEPREVAPGPLNFLLA